MTESAPAKVNLCLFLGPVRADGRHQLVTLFESISLADELALTVLPEGPDEVACPGVDGPNLVSAALRSLRDGGWGAPPVRIEISKRIPVAAGLGGGSADAAAALRLAEAVEPLPEGVALAIARRLGADVPSQLHPGLSLGTGAGEEVEALEPLGPHAFVIVPQPYPLVTAEVYQQADRLGLPRPGEDLQELHASVARAAAPGAVLAGELVVNDLEPATVALAPAVSELLEDLRQAGADQVLVCGSGPTVMGIYWGGDGAERAETGANSLRDKHPAAVSATPVLPSQ